MESKGGAQMAHLPPWLVKGLANPILGPIIQFFMVIFLLLLLVVMCALFLVYFVIHMVFWVVCCCGCGGHCWPRYGEGARIHAKRQERFMRMLRDYEAEAAMAQAKGEPMPDPNCSSRTGTSRTRRSRRHTHRGGRESVRVRVVRGRLIRKRA